MFKKGIPFSYTNTIPKPSSSDNVDSDDESFEEDSIKKVPNDYFTFQDLNNKNFNSEKNSLYMHLNISSLSYHHEELVSLIDNLNIKPKIIAISESKLRTGFTPTIDIPIPGYSYEHTPTNSTKGGTLIFISDKLKYRVRNDLKINKAKELESTFIEILNKKDKNIIIGCIYKHPKMPIYEFMESYMNILLIKLQNGNKNKMLLGDFNINLLNYDSDPNTTEFADSMFSSYFFPCINIPTRITPRSQTLIDNIFYNNINENLLAGNITSPISDHLIQFLIEPSSDKNESSEKITFGRSFHSFKKQKFEEELKNINWESDLNLERQTLKNQQIISLKLLKIY